MDAQEANHFGGAFLGVSLVLQLVVESEHLKGSHVVVQEVFPLAKADQFREELRISDSVVPNEVLEFHLEVGVSGPPSQVLENLVRLSVGVDDRIEFAGLEPKRNVSDQVSNPGFAQKR